MNKNNQPRAWVLEFIFYDLPLPVTNAKGQSQRRMLHMVYEQSNNYHQTVQEILRDWAKIVYLYALIYEFTDFLKKSKSR